MKAMILAAGRGERMRPLTDKSPKPLLRVGGKRLIEYHIQNLARCGFHDLIINHAWLGEQIEQVLGNGDQYGVRIQYSPEGRQAYETGGGIFNALPAFGDDPFLVVNGDVWTDYPFENISKRITGLAHLILVDNPQHNLKGDFHLTGGQVYNDGSPKLTFSGLGVYRKELFTGCEPGVFSIVPLLRKAMQQNQVSGEHYSGDWRDIGTPQRLADLDHELLSEQHLQG